MTNPAEIKPIDVYGFQSDELVKLIKRKALIDYPLRDPDEKLPIILRLYFEEMANGEKKIHNELLRLKSDPYLSYFDDSDDSDD